MSRRSIALVLVLGLASAGCGSLLNIERSEKTPIPLEPRPTQELQEAVRQQAAYAGDVLEQVYALGVEAGNAAVEQAGQAIGFVETVVGGPAERIALWTQHLVREATGIPAEGVPHLAPSGEFLEALAAAQRALEQDRAAHAAYKRALDAARAEQMGAKTGTHISSGWLGWLTGLGWVLVPIILVAVLVLVPNELLVLLVKNLVGALRALLGELLLRATRGLQQVVEGVQRGKQKMLDTQVSILGEQLLETTTPATRKIIARIKEDVKDKLRKEAEHG